MFYQDDLHDIEIVMQALPNAISFPVQLGGDYAIKMRFSERRLEWIPPKWRSLSSSIPVRRFEYDGKAPPANYKHIGILTGKQSNITVIECDNLFMRKLVGDESFDTLRVRTIHMKHYYYFQYEESLNSIYKLIHGMREASVWNDGCCVFTGWQYQVINNAPICKMPNSVLGILQNAQNTRCNKYDVKIYELMNILPDDWFDDSKKVNMLIDVINNVPSLIDDVKINTMRKLLRERCDKFNEELMVRKIPRIMTIRERQVGVAFLKKIVRRLNRQMYEAWYHKWNGRGDEPLKYRKDSLAKLKDVKAIYSKAELADMMKRHSTFKIVKRNICKSCKQLHHAGCCDEYSSTNRSSAMFIMNAYLSK
jgi:hypothetical protein